MCASQIASSTKLQRTPFNATPLCSHYSSDLHRKCRIAYASDRIWTGVQIAIMSRTDTFYSLGLMPALMGLGHLAPAIGAIQTATGSYQFPLPLLGLIGTISGLVDCAYSKISLPCVLPDANDDWNVAIDTYKDVPLSSRPQKWIWKTWTYGLWAIVAACTMMSGWQTAIIVYRVLPLGLLWGAPCIPSFSKSNRLSLTKPKTLVRPSRIE